MVRTSGYVAVSPLRDEFAGSLPPTYVGGYGPELKIFPAGDVGGYGSRWGHKNSFFASWSIWTELG